ncbi:MAG: tetratricopeptide repeat protein [Candidatus Kariarchaeaceae archaeon]|jgi:tetratricopeptide (TPR) repeat protein
MDFEPLKRSLRAGKFDQAKAQLEIIPDDARYQKESFRLLVDYELGDQNRVEKQSKELFNKVLDSKNWEAMIFIGTVRSQILADMGRLKETEEIAKIILPKIKRRDIKDTEILSSLGFLYNCYGNALFRLGKHTDALELYFTSLSIREEIEDIYSIAASYGNIANIYNETGSLIRAEEYYLKSLGSFKSSDYEYETRITFNNLGVVYLDQGRLDEAETMFQKSLSIAASNDDQMMVSVCYNNIGNVLRSKNQVKESLQYFLDAFKIREQCGNPFQLSYSYYYLVLTFVDLGDKESADQFLNKMEELHQSQPENKTFEIKFKILKVALLKNSIRLSQRAKCQKLLKEIIEDEKNHDMELTIQACIYYCELLLDELSTAKESEVGVDEEEKEIIEEVESYTRLISEIADKGNLNGMKIQAMILQSYIALSQFQIKEAKRLIDDAKALSENLGIRYFPIAIPKDERLTETSRTSKSTYSVGTLEIKKSVNKIIHSLPKLRIIFYLYEKPFATFMEMKNSLGFSPGKLGKHCDQLVDVNYLEKRKEFDGSKFVTTYRITHLGLQEFRAYTDNVKFQLKAIGLV